MGRFGEKLGHHLASYLKANPSILNRGNPAIGALERLFGSIGACYRTDSVQGGLRFRVTECPLDEAARRAGVQNLDLARFGINEMCRSLLLGLNPALIVTTSPESSAQFLFTLREAVTA
jgi:hypothetical protein